MAAKSTTKKQRRQRIFRLLAILFVFAFTLLVGELGVRLFLPRAYWNPRDATTDWAPDDLLGWVQKPNLDLTTQEDGGVLVRFHTNVDGLRPAEATRARHDGKERILLVGDSTVVGRLVPEADAPHRQLERLLPGVEVYNAGVEGYSTDQELLRLEACLDWYKPDLVLLVVCENDFGGNVSRVAYGLNKPIFQLQADGELVLTPPVPNARILDAQQSGWLRHSALYRAIRPRVSQWTARLRPWEERNLEGMASDFYYNSDQLEQVDWKLFTALLNRMQSKCVEKHAKFAFYAHPSMAEVWQPFIDVSVKERGIPLDSYNRFVLERRLQQVADANKIAFCPLVGYFAERQDRGPFHLLPLDPHCNANGYQVTAEAIASFLRMNQWVR